MNIGIIGGSGYTGVELLRLLLPHPEVNVRMVTSRGNEGLAVAEVYPSLRGQIELCFCAPDIQRLKSCDVIFFATPNGTAMWQVPELLAAGVRVIDLAADFRLKDVRTWSRWYGMDHACPELLAKAVYGLPELHRDELPKARLVANPGCYPTAVILALLPLIEENGVVLEGLVADAKSGVSGAGRKAAFDTAMGEMGESFKAYGLNGHRHLPEIVQALSGIAGQAVELTFVPHLLPMIRGIEVTVYARLREEIADPWRLYATRYGSEPFIDVLPAGVAPETRHVRGSNRVQLTVCRPGEGQTLVVSAVIDNLVKGAAGQAVQNLNLMYGFPEDLALRGIALAP